jgi:glycosyltransferase involved in cell wall biosynthesis
MTMARGQTDAAHSRPKILYLITEDWFFCRHFLPIARAAHRGGFAVVVAARPSAAAHQIRAEGFDLVEWSNDRGSMSPQELIRSIARLVTIVRRERPDVLQCISIRVALLGGIAARIAGVKATVLAPTGLGDLWLRDGSVAALARAATRFTLSRMLRRPGTHYLFENADDPREFGLSPGDTDLTIVNGPGVSPVDFPFSLPPPAPPLKVAIIARMLRSKGIADAVNGVRLARSRNVPVELHLFGLPDPSNRLSISERELSEWNGKDGIFWHGATDSPATVYRQHHVAMLLSWREGLPRTLVEAAAVGRPIVTTDVPGCREVVRDGIEGFVVPAGDVDRICLALSRLGQDEGLRMRMGLAARARFEQRFSDEIVADTVMRLYERLLLASSRAR